MRKSASLLCLILLLTSVAGAQISLGPAVGFHHTGYNQTISGKKIPHDGEVRIMNIRAGVVADIPFSRRLHLQPAVLYTTNGYFWDDPTSSFVKRFRINAVDVPLLISYHSGMKHQSHFFFNAGPFLAVHTGGFIAISQNNFVSEQRKKILPGSDTPADVRRLGAGAMLAIGYQLKNGIIANLHYQYGLKNIIPGPRDEGTYMTSNNYGLTLGYLFHPKTKKERLEKALKPKPSY